MDFRINGRTVVVDVDLRTSLLDLLRDHLGLTGAKKGCNQGACGACTVLVDGERINACLALAVQYQGREVTTVEGLGDGESLDPLQKAFVAHDGFQCGYCTPGQLCSAIGMASELARGVVGVIKRELRRRSAIEPLIGHIKDEGHLGRCYLKGHAGDAANAILSAVGHNFRRILAWLSRLLRSIFYALLAILIGQPSLNLAS
jgi:xanthine dehydrogenase YagT iron-sulfur-binding subunit